MNYFNSEQTAYMEALDKIPLNERCWCGWYRLGECPHCLPGKTCADKCPVCIGVGSRWQIVGADKTFAGADKTFAKCPDCNGTGLAGKEK